MTRTTLAANINYYISPTGSDGNDGLTPATAWATLQHARDVIAETLDLALFNVTVNVADGNYNGNLVATGAFVGATGPQSVRFLGNVSAPQNVHLIATGDAVLVADDAELQIEGMFISGGNRDLVISSGRLNFGSLWLDQCSLAMIDGCGARTRADLVNGGLVLLGGAQYAVLAEQAAEIVMRGYPIQLGGATPTFSQYVFLLDQEAIVDLTGASWLYKCHGKQYSLDSGAVLSTNGLGASWLPGDLPGVNLGGYLR